ncbi:TIM-barrel domain-containing protein [Mangrovimonas cancribranchiae]|uniref:Glycoside hydrolase family 31 protein n=1 Tax=Mangrovimonas cancribranchiae TaxID=3080055 RepID=A0AAU6P3N4_9FLAO
MKQIKYILFFLLFQVVNAQVTVVVEDLPEQTLNDASIFISGDFEGWSGGSAAYQLQNTNGHYSITLPKQKGSINFKFTQGSWETVESDEKGSAIDNHSYTFENPNDTLKLSIKGWTHLFDEQPQSTAAKNVTVISTEFEIPELNRKRRVWIYLPPNYKVSKKSFPVVYMHDGQNLFDATTSNFGEWEIDETLNKLFKEKQMELIVVGVDNGSDKRLDEYSPWEHEKYGGGEGDAYLEFIVNTLKPYIDTNYNTLTDKSNTGIFGSSMGGLISHYAALKYPQVFGKVGVYSPAFWFAPQVFDFTKNKANVGNTKMYFLAGGKEGEKAGYNEISQTVSDMNKMVETLKNNGFPSKSITSKVVPEGKHNEKLWRENFEEAILWLFPEAVTERKFVSAEFQDGEFLKIKMNDGEYKIEFYTPEIVETTFIPNGEQLKPNSHAVVLSKTASDVQFKQNDSLLTFGTDDFQVKAHKNPFKIAYWYKGKEVTSEQYGYQKTDGFESLNFNLKPDEILYGGGARALGMNRRGYRLELYNKAHYGYETHSELMNFTLPIVLSSNKYLLHFDNAPIGFLDLDSQEDNTLTYETISGRKTYQVVVGDSWYDIVDNYTNLTGKQPMLPRWALGNFSSRFGYHSQKETLETIKKFKKENIPVDAIILDLYWFGKEVMGTMGNLEFDRDSFPNPKQMIKTLRDQDVETILITEPFILTTSKRWEEAVANSALAKDSLGNPATYDFFFGNTGLVDVFSKSGYNWFKHINKSLLDFGVTGIWGDLGEPEVHPSSLVHETGTANEVHNIYGHDWAKLVQEAFHEARPNQRPFILMRAGYSGSQRYGMVPWSGDVNRTWGGLQSQPEIALQMGMQGLAYMHSDLGGFAGANLDDELYVRWLQYGIFQPIFRPHAQEEVASEPIFRSEKAKALAKQAIELRYKLLPYNYQMMYENNTQGKPLMRPLFFEEPENQDLLGYSKTYLWGSDILVAPILEADPKSQEVYFPKPSNWFDFYSDERFKGGSTTTYDLKEESIPTFVRGGSFVPMAKPIQSTKAYDGNILELHYYFDETITEKSKSQLYNDDGITANAYEKGLYEILQFEAEIKGRNLEIEFETELGANYQPTTKQIELIVHNIQKQPKRIKVDGKRQKTRYNSSKKTTHIPTTWNTKNNKTITLKLNL